MKRSTSLEEPPDQAIRIPATATTLAGFREWISSDKFPEYCRASYIQGEALPRSLSEYWNRNATSTCQ